MFSIREMFPVWETAFLYGKHFPSGKHPEWETFPKWEIVSHMGNRILGRISRMGNNCPDGQRGSD